MEQSTKSVNDHTLITHPGGSIIHNHKVYAFPEYNGTFKGVVNYYITLGGIYKWPVDATTAIMKEVMNSFSLLNINDMRKMHVARSMEEIADTIRPAKPRNKWLLIYAVGMISLIIILNICLFFVRHRVSWNMSTYSLLTILNVMGLAAFSIALWTYHANKQ